MNLKHLLVGVALLGGSLPAIADGNFLHIQTASGWDVLDLETVDRLTFKNGTMTATDTNEKVVASYSQSDLNRMFVSETAGVEAVCAEEVDATFSFDASSKNLRILADGELALYNLNGNVLDIIPEVKTGELINISALPAGVIIVKSGEYAAKIVLK